jgi:hypothetical protein
MYKTLKSDKLYLDRRKAYKELLDLDKNEKLL